MERIGIYGGTFSPPHNGHIHAAKAFFEKMALDKLMIVPTFIPPHKMRSEMTAPADRLQMCRLAFSFSRSIEISDLEIKRQGKSYTSDTLRALKGEGRHLFFLCGTDMLLTLDSWHEPEVIFALADIVCVARENDAQVRNALEEKAALYRECFGARVHILEISALELSSSEIRADISAQREWEEKLPSSVASYIKEKGLYR